MSAPSAGNEQAWQLMVVNDRQTLTKWASHCANVRFINEAPAAILVCRDIAAEKYAGYSVYDCCAVSENILLAAHMLGLGSVWGNVFEADVPFIQELLAIPEDVIPFSVLPIGHYKKAPEKPQSRFDANKVHWNSYGER